ncbi:MAG: hypothetical protein QOE79_1658 [Sphingomonadales bacterium]|jgi:hypothetical protein|nr:hypothetical protein [Sphingomonadales bacterium]MEA3048884.1 hypothetical protein [Sphingomonadales bacterium]
MRGPPPPIRFLLALVCGWTGSRIAMLAPWGGGRPAEAAPTPRAGKAAPDQPIGAAPILVAATHSSPSGATPGDARAAVERFQSGAPARPERFRLPRPLAAPPSALSIGTIVLGASRREAVSIAPVDPAAVALPPTGGRSRWSVSAWLFARHGRSDAAPVPVGLLGGSQAGARLTYRLGPADGGLSLSLRLYSPLTDARAAEAALGLDWKPRGVPLHLLVERRAKLGPDGRSAFALTAYGGADDVALGPLRLAAYGQAGAVGARRRDLFADGAARLTLPFGRLRIGAAAWAAAQPGVSRVDAGPHADLTFPLVHAAVTVSADWRFRLAGSARPGSGPAVTLSTGF